MVGRRSQRDGWVIAAHMILCTGVTLWVSCNAPQVEPNTRGVGQDSAFFSDVTEEAGLSDYRHFTGAEGDLWFPEIMGSGAAFLDYNGDGHLDILLVGGGYWGDDPPEGYRTLWLYRNDGNGSFTLRTREAGLSDVNAYGMGVVAADYDNDGDQDVLLTALRENKFFQNEGGVFVDVTEESGLNGSSEWSTAAVFFDANRDGWLDLYVGNYVKWSPSIDQKCTLMDRSVASYCTPEVYDGIRGRFYMNQADGTVTEYTRRAGFLPSPGKTLGAVELDYNRDGWSDLAVANDMERNLLYENNGDETFTEIGRLSGVAYGEDGSARAGMGITAGDSDNDGSESIYIGNFTGESIGVFKHEYDGLFADHASVSNVSRNTMHTLTFGLILLDVDLDSDLDLLAANGHIKPRVDEVKSWTSFRQRPQLFVNTGNDRFELFRPAVGSPMADSLVARGLSAGDVDGDGDVDVLITENGGPVHLWRNDRGRDRHYLRVHLVGTESSRDAVGAEVVIYVVGESLADVRRIRRRVRGGGSYLSQSEKTLTFGLGQAETIDSLVVRWPSGHVDRLEELEADQDVTIRESSSGSRAVIRTRSEGP